MHGDWNGWGKSQWELVQVEAIGDHLRWSCNFARFGNQTLGGEKVKRLTIDAGIAGKFLHEVHGGDLRCYTQTPER